MVKLMHKVLKYDLVETSLICNIDSYTIDYTKNA